MCADRLVLLADDYFFFSIDRKKEGLVTDSVWLYPFVSSTMLYGLVVQDIMIVRILPFKQYSLFLFIMEHLGCYFYNVTIMGTHTVYDNVST